TCYTENTTSTRYEILGRATVETRRGCEVLCNAQVECVALSFKDAGLKSSCILLSAATEKETCDAPSDIFLKKTTGCVARTNLTEEFSVDPCVDEIVPSAFQGFGVKEVC
ncbi:hypothetical protein PMAYCL1PPCAC_27025, partial [Pristionchus mayeri]